MRTSGPYTFRRDVTPTIIDVRAVLQQQFDIRSNITTSGFQQRAVWYSSLGWTSGIASPLMSPGSSVKGRMTILAFIDISATINEKLRPSFVQVAYDCKESLWPTLALHIHISAVVNQRYHQVCRFNN